MNLVLFEPHELGVPLPPDDRRTRHVLQVLRLGPGDSFDAGIVDGPRGRATIQSIQGGRLHLRFEWGEEPPPLEPVRLVVGLPRPQTARKVLEEATALGVQAMDFVRTDLGEASYAQSKLWSTGEWRRHLIAGAEQASSTRLPAVTWGRRLAEVLGGLPETGVRLALDNDEGMQPLSAAEVREPVVLAVGPERGWSEREKATLRKAGFAMAHLGERVLRVETACVAGVALVLAKLGRM